MRKICTTLLILLLFMAPAIFAQTQQGYVKTLGRPEKAGEPLSGVTIRVKGEHNSVNSHDDGSFSLLMTDKKNGEAYALQQVQKNGYELNETDILGRQFAFSDKVPLTIVMVSSEQLKAEKQRIENNAYKTAEKNYKAKAAQIEKQLQDSVITMQQYRESLLDLQDKFEKYQSLIDGLAEHYAHTDYDFLNEKDREINLCIENGALERADSLIRLLFDPIGVLERYMEALARIDQQKAQAQDLLSQANEDMAAVLKQQEKDAEYLYQLYTIALARYDFDKASGYIETRAELDTTNAKWQFDAACYFHKQNDFNRAEKYYARDLSIRRNQNDLYSLAMTLNNLAIIYSDTQRLTESEAMYFEALDLFRILAQDNPQAHEPNVALMLNNLANLYYAAQRLTECEALHLEALAIRRRLAQKKPQTHEPDVAITLNNLANLYYSTQRPTESEAMYLEALEIRRRLAQDNPQVYEPDLAQTLNNLALLYSDAQRFSESETLYLEALEISRRLAMNNPQAYRPYVAGTLFNLANLYSDTQRLTESETFYLEALQIRRCLAADNSKAYEAGMAKTMDRLATLYNVTQRPNESEAMYLEALEIRRRLAQNNLQIYEPYLAGTLYNLGLLHLQQEQYFKAISDFEDCLAIYRKLKVDNPSYGDLYQYSLYWLTQLYPNTDRHARHYEINKEWLHILKGHYQEDADSYLGYYTNALGSQSFQCLFVGQLEQSEQYAKEALAIDPTLHWINTNLAAALLFQGKYDEAEAIYRQYKDELKDSFLQDLNDFEAAGAIPEDRKGDVERIKTMLTE